MTRRRTAPATCMTSFVKKVADSSLGDTVQVVRAADFEYYNRGVVLKLLPSGTVSKDAQMRMSTKSWLP